MTVIIIRKDLVKWKRDKLTCIKVLKTNEGILSSKFEISTEIPQFSLWTEFCKISKLLNVTLFSVVLRCEN